MSTFRKAKASTSVLESVGEGLDAVNPDITIEAIHKLFEAKGRFHCVPLVWMRTLRPAEALMVACICWYYCWVVSDDGKKRKKFRGDKLLMTQQQLGRACGLSRFGAGRVMWRLREGGYIDFRDTGRDSAIWCIPEKIAELFNNPQEQKRPPEERNRTSDEQNRPSGGRGKLPRP